MNLCKEVSELIEQYDKISKGAGSSDWMNWCRKAYKVLKKVKDYDCPQC